MKNLTWRRIFLGLQEWKSTLFFIRNCLVSSSNSSVRQRLFYTYEIMKWDNWFHPAWHSPQHNIPLGIAPVGLFLTGFQLDGTSDIHSNVHEQSERKKSHSSRHHSNVYSNVHQQRERSSGNLIRVHVLGKEKCRTFSSLFRNLLHLRTNQYNSIVRIVQSRFSHVIDLLIAIDKLIYWYLEEVILRNMGAGVGGQGNVCHPMQRVRPDHKGHLIGDLLAR